MKYTVYEIIKNLYSFFLTKLYFKNARLIRFPSYIRGKKYMKIGDGFTTGYGCRLDAFYTKNRISLDIGKNCKINDYVHIGAIEKIIIEDNVLIASKVFITDHNHGKYDTLGDSPQIPPDQRELYSKPVHIKSNVWLGENVVVLPGAIIGKGCIIGANSVIIGEIPDYTIAVGSPAKIIKKYNFESNMWEKIE